MTIYDHTYISLLTQSSTFTVFVYYTIIYLAINSTLFWIILDINLNLYIMTDKSPSYNFQLLLNINNKQQNEIMLHYRSDWNAFRENDICLQLVYISLQYEGKAFKNKGPKILLQYYFNMYLQLLYITLV